MSAQITINPLNCSTVFIEMLFEDQILGKGTAFYIRKDEKLYLISNWHNYSGRKPETNIPIHSQLAIPNKIKTYGYRIKENPNQIEPFEITHNLENENGDALWFEHPDHGRQIDVAALPIQIANENEILDIYAAIDEIDPHDNMVLKIGESLFVIGYPFGVTADGYLPIWKSASIASEPAIDCDNLPMIYIDTATREGMSGSPVIKYKDRTVAIGPDSNNLCTAHAEFVGVYSGRIIPQDLIEVQLGKVWKENCIEAILNGNPYTNN